MATVLHKTRFPNLYRADNGNFWLRTRAGGKWIRRSLKDNEGNPIRNERIAKIAVIAELNRLGVRNALKSGFGRNADGSMSWGEAVDEWIARQLARPDLKESSKEAKEYEAKLARGVCDDNLDYMHDGIFENWWSGFVHQKTKRGTISVRTCNKVLDVVKAVSAWAHANGLAPVDGAHGLKHLSAPDRFKVVPSREDVRAVVSDMRVAFASSVIGKHKLKLGGSLVCVAADYVEFLAYSGARHAEARLFCWEDVLKDGVVLHGVKRGRDRFVPFNSGLEGVVCRLREQVVEAGGVCAGKVFGIDSPRLSLERACKRLGVVGVNLHGLRHFFITSCMEAGVLPATIAKWVGHVDGGVLIAKTYTHIRDEHSRAEAKKLAF